MQIPCEDCHNTGEISEIDVDANGLRVRYNNVPCYTCDGTGYLKAGTSEYERALEKFFSECLGLQHEILRQMGHKPN